MKQIFRIVTDTFASSHFRLKSLSPLDFPPCFTVTSALSFRAQLYRHFRPEFRRHALLALSLCSLDTFRAVAQLAQSWAQLDVVGPKGARFEPRRARFRVRIGGYAS